MTYRVAKSHKSSSCLSNMRGSQSPKTSSLNPKPLQWSTPAVTHRRHPKPHNLIHPIPCLNTNSTTCRTSPHTLELSPSSKAATTLAARIPRSTILSCAAVSCAPIREYSSSNTWSTPRGTYNCTCRASAEALAPASGSKWRTRAAPHPATCEECTLRWWIHLRDCGSEWFRGDLSKFGVLACWSCVLETAWICLAQGISLQ